MKTDYLATLIVCIDSSANVGLDNWKLLIKFIQDVSKEADIGLNRNHFGVLDIGTLSVHVWIFFTILYYI